MGKGSYWYSIAKAKILYVLDEAKTDGVTNEDEIRKRVDAAYPFGQRKYHPYKQWLKARRDIIGASGKTKKSSPGVMARLMAWEEGKKIG